jgi:hypothetical protein
MQKCKVSLHSPLPDETSSHTFEIIASQKSANGNAASAILIALTLCAEIGEIHVFRITPPKNLVRVQHEQQTMKSNKILASNSQDTPIFPHTCRKLQQAGYSHTLTNLSIQIQSQSCKQRIHRPLCWLILQL